MSAFFDDYLNVKKIFGSKHEYKQQMARIALLPEEYQYVAHRIMKYMWMYCSGAGYDMMKIHYDLIELFETGAADGRSVLEITGDDVAAFCDELLKGASTYTADWREKLNRDIQQHVGKKQGGTK